VARDRQRAKQRKARRAQNPGSAQPRPHPADPPSPLDHNVPSELGHLGEVDEFEAAIVEGADRSDEASEALGEEPDPEAGREAVGEVEDDEDLDEELDEELEEQAVAAAPAERQEVAATPTPGAPTRRGPARFIGFLRASWAELQRVQWPDRRAVAQATAVVIGFVVVAGLYLGVADWIAKKIVDFIL
jgi:preprotein translocase SecE subunit